VAVFSNATTLTTGQIYDTGNVAVGKISPINGKLDVNGNFFVTGSAYVSGTVYGAAKSFLIDHPTKAGMKLQYGVTEGPEHSVFVRGKSYSGLISLPDYWCDLVDYNTLTVQLTPVGKFQKLFVSSVNCSYVYISNEDNGPIECYYFVQAERKDIPKLTVEY
jgi:hypothetical protein